MKKNLHRRHSLKAKSSKLQATNGFTPYRGSTPCGDFVSLQEQYTFRIRKTNAQDLAEAPRIRFLTRSSQNLSQGPVKPSHGFTLLFAVLASSLLLAVSLAIFNVALKEAVLSSSAKDSQLAFYAADTGVECALYWDLRSSPPGSAFDLAAVASSITCAGSTISTGSQTVPTDPPQASQIGAAATSIFFLDFSPSAPSCAIVTVDKTNPPLTVVESRGFNACQAGNTRRVERAIRTVY